MHGLHYLPYNPTALMLAYLSDALRISLCYNGRTWEV
jgi:hypothetical protein